MGDPKYDSVFGGSGGGKAASGGAIDVPAGYVAKTKPGYGDLATSLARAKKGTGTFSGGNFKANPLYFDGDEFVPVKGMRPEDIKQVQELMIQAGLIGQKTKFTIGAWNNELASIWKSNVLGPANARGLTWRQYVNQLIDAGGVTTLDEMGGGGGPAQVPVRKVTNPDDLMEIFRDSSQKIIGHRVSEGEIGSMILAYQSMETAAQDQVNAASLQEQQLSAAGGGVAEPVTVTAPPDPSSYLAAEMRRRHPGEVAATEGAGLIQSGLDFIRNGV